MCFGCVSKEHHHHPDVQENLSIYDDTITSLQFRPYTSACATDTAARVFYRSHQVFPPDAWNDTELPNFVMTLPSDNINRVLLQVGTALSQSVYIPVPDTHHI